MCLVIVACVGSLAVPSYADELEDSAWLNLMDYTTPNDSGSYRVGVSAPSSTFTMKLPSILTVFRLDIVVSAPLTATDLYLSFGNVTLNRVKVGNTGSRILYRFYGIGGQSGSALTLTAISSSNTYFYLEQFLVSTYQVSSFDDVVNSTVTGGTFDTLSLTYDPSNLPAAGYANVSFGASSTSGSGQVNINFICPNWKKYDYLDVYCAVHLSAIESVLAYFDGGSVPVSVTYLQSSTGVNNTWPMVIRLDLRGLDRSSSEYPTVRIQGTYAWHESNYWRIFSCVGHVVSGQGTQMGLFSGWFFEVCSWLSQIRDKVAQLEYVRVELTELNDFVSTIPSSIGQFISSQTSALQDSLVSMTSSIRGMFTSLNGWISDQTTALSNKLDEVIAVLNPEADSSTADSLLDQSEQIHAFESSHQDVLSNGLTTMQGASVISRPHFASALSFIGMVSSAAFQKLDFMQIIYTLPLVIGLIMFLASRAPGRRHDSPRKVDESKPSRHYQNNDAGGYYRWDGHV